MADLIVGLYDTNTDTLLTSLANGAVVSSSALSQTTTVSVEIDPSGSLVGQARSMRLSLSDGTVTYARVDNNAPYTLFGDAGTNLLNGINFGPGDYTLRVEVFSGGSGNGKLLAVYDFGFSIVVNDPPVAVADTATTLEDTAVVIDVLGNDSDVEDGSPDPTTVEIVGADDATGKVKTAAGQGVWSVDLTTGAITFTPEAGYSGAVTPIDYSVRIRVWQKITRR